MKSNLIYITYSKQIKHTTIYTFSSQFTHLLKYSLMYSVMNEKESLRALGLHFKFNLINRQTSATIHPRLRLSGAAKSASNISVSPLPQFASLSLSLSLYLSLSLSLCILTPSYATRCRKLLANANPHIGIALFRLPQREPCDEGRRDAWGGWLAFAYSSAVLPSTFPATHPPWNSAGTRWCGYALASDRRGTQGIGRGQQSCISSLIIQISFGLFM